MTRRVVPSPGRLIRGTGFSGTSAWEAGAYVSTDQIPEIGSPLTIMGAINCPTLGTNGNSILFQRAQSSNRQTASGYRLGTTRTSASTFVGLFEAGYATTRMSKANGLTFNTFQDLTLAATWDGGAAASGVAVYSAVEGEVLKQDTGGTSNDGVGAAPSTGQPFGPGGFGTASTLFYAAVWNRILDLAELQKVQRFGPLSIRRGLCFCWAEGRDWGPGRLNPVLIPPTRGEVFYSPYMPPLSRFGGLRRVHKSLIKTVNGLPLASVKTINGLAIASVKKWNGLLK